jgi:hypothetical protein
MNQTFFDPTRYTWREVVGDPSSPYKIKHEYTVLGGDAQAGTLDMIVRWAGDGGHCPKHRHAATTTVLVLEGEQHLWDIHPDGSLGEHTVRRPGDYALSVGDGLPHLERGGDEGASVFFGCHTTTGVLYEMLDEDGKIVAETTVEGVLADWSELA